MNIFRKKHINRAQTKNLNRFLLRFFSSLTLITSSVTLGIIFSTIFLILTLDGVHNAVVVIVFSFMCLFPCGLLFGNCMFLSLGLYPKIAGIATGFQFTLLFIFFGIVGLLMGSFPSFQITLAIACVSLALGSVVVLLLYFFGQKNLIIVNENKCKEIT